MNLLDRVIDVIEDNDTSMQVTNKIVNKYPEYFIKKLHQCRPADVLGVTNDILDISYRKKALEQIRAEVSNIFTRNKNKDFYVNKSKKPYQYSVKIDFSHPLKTPEERKGSWLFSGLKILRKKVKKILDKLKLMIML